MGGYCSTYVHEEDVIVTGPGDVPNTYKITNARGTTGRIFTASSQLKQGETIRVWVEDETGTPFGFMDPFPGGKPRAYKTDDGRYKLYGNPCKSMKAAQRTGNVCAVLLACVFAWMYVRGTLTLLPASSMAVCFGLLCVVSATSIFTSTYNSFVFHETVKNQ